MLKMKIWLVFSLFLLCFLGLTDAGQETFEILNLYNAAPEVVQTMSRSVHPFAVYVSNDYIDGVSSSVLKAETWLRTHVLSHFPAAKITTIVVGDGSKICQIGQNHNLGMVLPSVKNIYYALTRWGLEREIKVSAVFSSQCFHPNSALFRDYNTVEKVTKPLLQFLHSANSTYSINVPSKVTPLSDELFNLESFHANLLKKFGSSALNKVNLIISTNPNRKLMNIEPQDLVRPIDPFPETSEPPIHSSIGVSVPSTIAKNPHPPSPNSAPSPFAFPVATPPQMGSLPFATPPMGSLPFATPPPKGSLPFAPPPFSDPAMSPLPPCSPADTPAPGVVVQELWCVAKPSVPAETLQEALDYACGDGGADCDQIMPSGSCYYPDTVVAHSSYAFNSYYQKFKRIGGSCSFGGTAMLITSDPSYLNCRFHLS